MGNFSFLQSQSEYELFSAAAVEAEKVYAAAPAMCAVGCRKALELAIKWVYAADRTMSFPQRDNLQSMLREPTFRNSVPPSTWQKLSYIVKLGNRAVHSEQTVQPAEAMQAMRVLFEFVQWLDCNYGDSYKKRTFDKNKVPQGTVPEKSDVVSRQEEEIRRLQQQIAEMSEKFTASRQQHSKQRQFVPDDLNEYETRQLYIDNDLKDAGWVFEGLAANVKTAYPVQDSAGRKSQADYVLFGKDGLPLAVIEAKRTSADPNSGRNQALRHADCLQRQFGRRPMMFTTNGFSTYFWDDETAPQRQVSGPFDQESLQRLMDRRTTKKPLADISVNERITDRYYQKEAVRAVCQRIEQGFRKSLVLMAAGTGKTRVAASLADVLRRGGHAQKVLYLAERSILSRQAKADFAAHLPDVSLCDLQTKRDDRGADIVFATYSALMSALDEEKDGRILFSPAHFDLIVVDESHKGIFAKYAPIFAYFDAMVLGLTAMPEPQIDRETWQFFELPQGKPAYAYHYRTAVQTDHVLVPYYRAPVSVSIEEEKLLFDRDMVDTMLRDLMETGLRVSMPDRLAKSIVFAQNAEHAEYILQRFNKLYPGLKGRFAQRVLSGDSFVQDVVDAFKQPIPPAPYSPQKETEPHIVIAVDMLDSGVDVPQIGNLVFFRRERSRARFWQMVGRGVRRCDNMPCRDDLDGEYLGKRRFYVFDYCGNFEYFSEQHDEGEEYRSLAQAVFIKRVRLMEALQSAQYLQPELQTMRRELAEICRGQILSLEQSQMAVRLKRRYISRYTQPDELQCIDEEKLDELIQHIAPLLCEKDDSVQTDDLLYSLMLAVMQRPEGVMRLKEQLLQHIRRLQRQASRPEIQKILPLLQNASAEDFWQRPDLAKLEQLRKALH